MTGRGYKCYWAEPFLGLTSGTSIHLWGRRRNDPPR